MGSPEIAAARDRVFAAVRLMLATSGADIDTEQTGPAKARDLAALQSAVQALDSPADRWQLVANLAAVVRWASVETGRPENDIVDDLEHQAPSNPS